MKKSIFVLFLSSILVLTPVLGVFADTEADAAADDGKIVEEFVQEKPEAAVVETEKPKAEENVPEDAEGSSEVKEEAELEGALPENSTVEGDDQENQIQHRSLEGQKGPDGDDNGEACLHEDTYVEYSGYGDDAVYESIDNREHRISGKVTKNTYCCDCGVLVSSEEIENYDGTEDHEYDDEGVCIYCKHKNTCTHEDTEKWLEFGEDATYTPENDKYHLASGSAYEVISCDDCGKILSKEFVGEKSEEQWHDYDTKGICRICGYENQCEHENKFTWIDFDEDATYTPENDKYHLVSGETYEYTYCPDCCQTLSRESAGYDEEEEWHEFEDGVCTLCRYENQCEHKHKERWLDFDEDANATYTPENNKYHLVSGEAYEVIECVDCGEILSRDFIGNTSDRQQHDYDTNGVCEICGYENECEHEDQETWLEFGEDATYTPENNRYHLVSGEATEITYCNDCGQRIGERSIGYTEDYEEWHDYDENGVCAICGYENQCEHEDTDTWLDFDENATYESIDNEYHLASGEAYMVTYCCDCDQTLSREYVGNTSEKDWHWYEDGVCRLCNHECEHEDTDTWLDFRGNYTYAVKDNKYHTISGEAYEITYCTDCGKTLSEKAVGYRSEDVEHTYDWNHVCEDCGHENTCDHPNDKRHTYYDYDRYDVDVEDKDNKYHTVTGLIYEVTDCELCGEELEGHSLGVMTIEEEHSYDEDGECICGHTEIPVPEGFAQDEAGNWYYYDADGVMQTGWKQVGDSWYYMDPKTGIRSSGWLNYGGKRYYLDPDNNDAMVSDDWCKVSGAWYNFDADGVMQTGWISYKYVNYDGTVEEDWYYLEPSGKQVFGWKKIGNTWYYFEEEEEDGLMATGTWYVDSSKRTYLFSKSGAWQENTTAWIQEYGTWYYFEKGVAKTGWQQIGGTWYFFDTYGGMYANEWAKDSGGWCWMDSNGKMTKDKWIQYDGDWYYIKANGYRAANEWAKDSGGWYWMDADGLITTDKWIKAGNEWYYLKENGYMAANEWAEDSDNTYWMDGSGKISRSKWIKADDEWYYMDANGQKTVNAWVKDSTGWMYLDDEGKITKNGWAKDSSGWCWLGSDGYITKGKWIQYDGDWYYLNASGYRVESKWEKDSKGWCYLDADGKMVTDDWAKDSVGWCWIGSDGYIVYSQWVNDGNSYVDNRGYRVTGKQVINGKTYEFDANGNLIS